MAQPAPYSNPFMGLQSPDQIAGNRKLGQKMMMDGMSADPVQHWTQALARVLGSGVGRMNVNAADEAAQARQGATMSALDSSGALGGLSPADRALIGADPEMMRSALSKVYGDKLDPSAGMRRDLMREQIEGARQDRAHRAEMQPIELEAKKRSLQTDPLMIVPPGATVLNRTTGQATQPGGPNWDKLPEFAAKSAAFSSRMVDAERNVRGVLDNAAKRAAEKKGGFDPTAPSMAVYNAMPEALANLTVRDPDHQSYRQAAEQWIRAFLRKESGAAISADEFKRDFVVYFPQPGDSQEVIQQKQEARFMAMKGFAEETRGYFAHTNPRGAKILDGWKPNEARRPAMSSIQAGMQAATQPAAAPRQVVPQAAPPVTQPAGRPTPPAEAIKMLHGDPSPDAMREFDEMFGAGAARRALRMQ